MTASLCACSGGGIIVDKYVGMDPDAAIPAAIGGKAVTNIHYAFEEFGGLLRSVTVPDGVVEITGAFKGCKNLTSVMLPNSLSPSLNKIRTSSDKIPTRFMCIMTKIIPCRNQIRSYRFSFAL